jgi:sialidase-1
MTAARRLEGDLDQFCGPAQLEMREIFEAERFPNVVVAMDGTVLATWGAKLLVARRSEDGGRTWGPEIEIGQGIHAGGVTVDETCGDILLFGHPEHPPGDSSTALRTMYRSTDAGWTWAPEEAVYQEDAHGRTPSLHMAEHGVTLRRGPHPGRLLRPARVYAAEGGYNTAIYSDDHGRTWSSSQPFPVDGTGEGAVAELADGRVYYSSRRHRFAPDEELRCQRLGGCSHDGGQSWVDAQYSKALPDGPRYRGTDPRGANYNGHFGMAAGLTRLPVADSDILVYSNADHDGHERIRMTVWVSPDGGRTWPLKRLVSDGPSAYSSLEAGRPGTPSQGWIYLQFEERGAGGRMARFNLSWLLEGELTGDGPLPEELGAAGR